MTHAELAELIERNGRFRVAMTQDEIDRLAMLAPDLARILIPAEDAKS